MAHNAAQVCAQLGQKYPSLPNLKLEIKGASSANGPNLPPWIASLEFLGQKITIHEIKEKKAVTKRILCDLLLGNVFEEHREKLEAVTIPYVQLHYVSKSEYTEVPEGVVLPSYDELMGYKVGKKAKGLAPRDSLDADAMLRNAVRYAGLKIDFDVVCENIGLVEKLMIDANGENVENAENVENSENAEKTENADKTHKYEIPEKSDEVFVVAIKDDESILTNPGENDEPVSNKPKFPTSKYVRMTIVLNVLTISETDVQSFFTGKQVSESVVNDKLAIALVKKEIKNQLSEEALQKLLELEKIPAKDVILWTKEQKLLEKIEKHAELTEFRRKQAEEKMRQKEENKFQHEMKKIEARDNKLQKRIDMEQEKTKRYQHKQESYMEIQRGKQMWRGSNNRNVGSVREQFRSAGDISNEYIQGHSGGHNQTSGFRGRGRGTGVKRDIYGNRCSNPLMEDRRQHYSGGRGGSQMANSDMSQLARAWQTGYNQSNYDQNYQPNQPNGNLPIRKSDSHHQNNHQNNYSNPNKPDPSNFGW